MSPGLQDVLHLLHEEFPSMRIVDTDGESLWFDNGGSTVWELPLLGDVDLDREIAHAHAWFDLR